jgi:hypothetical protein
MVLEPKSKGGLGVINLRLQNDALLLKQLHKFYNTRISLGCSLSGQNTTAIKFRMELGRLDLFGRNTS